MFKYDLKSIYQKVTGNYGKRTFLEYLKKHNIKTPKEYAKFRKIDFNKLK